MPPTTSRRLNRGNGRGRGLAVVPDPIPALGPKADYDSELGLFTTAGGSTPAVSAADPVGRWEDQSGNGYHLTNPTAGNRPTRSATTFKGYRAVDFDTTNSQWLQNAAFPWTQSVSSGTWIVAVQYDVGNPSSAIVSTTQDQLGILQEGYVYLNSAAGTFGFNSAAIATRQGMVQILRYDGTATGDAGRLRMWRNLSESTLAYNVTVPASTYPGGTTLYLGRQAAGGYLKTLLGIAGTGAKNG